MLIFVDGKDEVDSGPSEQQPNVFVTKQNMLGEEEYDEKICLSLRIGSKIIFEDLNLSQALAGCIIFFLSHFLPGAGR